MSELAQRPPQDLLASTADWWRDAAIYQVYIRSFADANGDGVGDIAGLRSRLPYLADLGVDALWINPWYPSPLADGGYDVADYRAIEPAFGTLDEAKELIDEAHGHGIRILLDIVINHTSDKHAWFAAALAANPGSPERARYHFRDGRGQDGELPPNNWWSAFGGPAWTRVREADGTPGQWYLHLFSPSQPDLNWANPEVHVEFESVLRFWFDMGIAGFRIDAATAPAKAPGLPDLAGDPREFVYRNIPEDHPYWDRDELHEIYREWRQIADSYAEPKVFAAEAWVDGPQRLSRYLRPDELHTAFNFGYLEAPWIASSIRAIIDESLEAVTGVGAAATWVLSNHDVIRPPSRYGRTQKDISATGLIDLTDPLDLELGIRRSRAAALLTLALPGSVYVYQGEELGLWEVEDLPEEVLQDPFWERSGRTERGRDGCRVPLPWSGSKPSLGFSPDGATAAPWLPQPTAWLDHSVQAQTNDRDSMLELYRTALQLRRELRALGPGALRWLRAPDDVLLFARDAEFACAVNLGDEPWPLPHGSQVLLASRSLDDQGRLPADTAVWIALSSTANLLCP